MFIIEDFEVRLNKILLEGGNAPYIDRETGEEKGRATKVDISKLGRSEFVGEFLKVFAYINGKFKREHGKPLWDDFGVVDSGFAFNGSSESLFDKNIDDETFLQHKPVVGDIDIIIPRDKLKPLFELLEKLEGKNITSEVTYLGQNKKTQHGHQINAVFEYKGYKPQIDFEGSEYIDSKPSDFAKFGHSSDWEDVKKGFKGLFHKFWLMTLVATMSAREDVILATPASTPEKIRKKKMTSIPKELSFSVDRGLRIKIAPMLDEHGNQVELEDKKVYKELPTASSSYEQNIENIFKLVFDKTPDGNDLKKFKSFVGLVELSKKHIDSEVTRVAFESTLKMLWAPGAQGLEVNNPELDSEIKTKMVEYLISEFGFTGYDEKINKMRDEYKANYRTVKVEGEA
jgi:hypothetical protein